MVIKDMCWVCGSKKSLTIHHLREVKAKKKGKPNGEIPVCRDCHDLIEAEKVHIRWGKKVQRLKDKYYKKGYEDGSREITQLPSKKPKRIQEIINNPTNYSKKASKEIKETKEKAREISDKSIANLKRMRP